MYWSPEEIAAAKSRPTRYKCHNCYFIVDEIPCPACGNDSKNLIEKMCPLDHCHCPHAVIGYIEYCPLCKQPICPECGTHDVEQISRVTGYLQSVTGWNMGKREELKDRHRYQLSNAELGETNEATEKIKRSYGKV